LRKGGERKGQSKGKEKGREGKGRGGEGKGNLPPLGQGESPLQQFCTTVQTVMDQIAFPATVFGLKVPAKHT